LNCKAAQKEYIVYLRSDSGKGKVTYSCDYNIKDAEYEHGFVDFEVAKFLFFSLSLTVQIN
jgi:hypothetical protein